jgi:hypothetical protein
VINRKRSNRTPRYNNTNKKSNSIPTQNPLAQHSLLMHERHPPPNNTIATNPQIQISIQTESTAAMCDVWNIEAVQYGGFAEAAGG